MTRDRKITYLISIGLFVVLLGIFLFPEAVRPLAAALMAVAAVLSLLLLGKRTAPSLFYRQVLLILAVSAVLYVILLYLAGLEFGFFPSLAFSLATVVGRILPTVVAVVATELYRRVMLVRESRVATVFSYFAAVAVEVMVFGDLAGIRSFNLFMELVGITLLPAMAANLLYHYVAKQYGIIPNLVYRLILCLYPFVFRVIPTLPGALHSFANLLYPLLLMLFLSALFEKRRRYALKRPSKVAAVALLLLLLLMVLLVMLVSCQFRFGMIVIASESMEEELSRGDAVVYERYDGGVLTEGEVILFETTGQTTVHRIVKIERINSETRYYTRGDANEDLDPGYITGDRVIGVCRFKLPFVGYPTLWLRSILSFK